jgi:Tfp pilus assembly PilM family ATPase
MTPFAVDGVQSDCVALYNALACEFRPEEAVGRTSEQVVAAVDVGAAGSNIVIVAPQHIWFRSVSLGSADFVRALSNQLQLTTDQARELLLQPARARRYRLRDLRLGLH